MTKKLKEVRLKSGLSQSELSSKSNINLRMIQHYEQEVKNLNNARLDILLRLCITLNCKLEDILTDTNYLELLKEYKKDTIS